MDSLRRLKSKQLNVKTAGYCLILGSMAAAAGFVFFIFFLCRSAFADASSANFKLESNFQSGGEGIAISSTNFRVEEGTFDWGSNQEMSSTNYKVEIKIGINGTELIPVISGSSPGGFVKLFTDQPASFSVTASSPDGQSLQYQAKQDGISKAGPQVSNVLSWALAGSDRGRRAVDLVVIENDGTVTRQQPMFVLRRPVK